MNIKRINALLTELMNICREIEGSVLVSSDGQLLTEAIGIDNQTGQLLAGTFLHLMQNTCQEFDDSEIESISLKGQDGYVIFTSCYSEVFLLIKASHKVSVGFLKREIELMSKKLQTEFQETSSSVFSSYRSTAPELLNSSTKTGSSKFNRNERSIQTTSIRYRGLFKS
ncbi:Roadblock/LC7 family protein [Gloeothece citriformis PCC 7424]|uniref:Roadblock/LC7 family protein n=1 Tax=Gloeothece citriformis (strain PCC 7424) TaxID=65393 RepID=B7KL95_GLOC7|nr:roadblock/LC7 domain-containing protein [Gloeothece citriformis]ACK72467.1 Roadblock/LC7 family protein [Gloeothece citriformis PCC 7424]